MMTTPTPEQVEKARQGIMRMRELLDFLRMHLEMGEKAYARLFEGLSAEDIEGLKEKEVQRLAAYNVIRDRTLITNPALGMRFNMRDLEHAFEELHDHFVVEEVEDES